MPVDTQAARKAGRSPALSLMPLSFASILGGMITLIGRLLYSGPFQAPARTQRRISALPSAPGCRAISCPPLNRTIVGMLRPAPGTDPSKAACFARLRRTSLYGQAR